MINDDEMRDIFRVESGEHLQALDDGLLRLEQAPLDRAILDEVFREAHSLKGAARMLSLPAIEAVSHRLEDLLGGAHRNEAPLTPERIQLLHSSLDALRKLCDEALTGIPSGVSVAGVLARLKVDSVPSPQASHRGKEVAEDPSSVTVTSKIKSVDADSEVSTEPSPVPVRSTTRPFQVETVRVETRKLNLLMTRTAELAVAHQRIARRNSQVDELMTAWERLTGEHRRPGGRQTDLKPGIEQITELLEQLKGAIHEDSSRLEAISRELEEGVKAIRLIPLATIFNAFPKMVRDLAVEQGKEADLEIEGGRRPLTSGSSRRSRTPSCTSSGMPSITA